MSNVKLGPTGAGSLPLERLERVDRPKPEATGTGKGKAPAQPFSEFLGQQLQNAPKTSGAAELKFSAHAQARLQSRGIELSPDDMLKMREAVQKAGEKGSRESLILSDKGAFVVSVKNNTVITAIDKDSLKDNVFTNIDSTVMI